MGLVGKPPGPDLSERSQGLIHAFASCFPVAGPVQLRERRRPQGDLCFQHPKDQPPRTHRRDPQPAGRLGLLSRLPAAAGPRRAALPAAGAASQAVTGVAGGAVARAPLAPLPPGAGAEAGPARAEPCPRRPESRRNWRRASLAAQLVRRLALSLQPRTPLDGRGEFPAQARPTVGCRQR